mgnify:FL=1
MAKTYDFDDFCQITEMLRKKEGGCPWDLSQTHQSLKPYMLSETAEAVAAIDLYEQTKDASNLCEELGDMLFQVVIQSQIAAEEGLFTINDVVQSISEKMIRRHPHVFGKSMLSDQGEPVTDWDAIKKQEKAGKEWTEAYLPGALEEAEKLLERAKERKGIKK